MAMLGEITLRFGARGEADEEPLRFEARPLNLIVGPNNSGKSLLLRELSGIDPRQRRRYRRRARSRDENAIIATAAWSAERASVLRAQIDAELRREGLNPIAARILELPWDRRFVVGTQLADSFELQHAQLVNGLRAWQLKHGATLLGISCPCDADDADLLWGALRTYAAARRRAQRRTGPSPSKEDPGQLSAEAHAQLEGLLHTHYDSCARTLMELELELGLSFDSLAEHARRLPVVGDQQAADPELAAQINQTFELLRESFEGAELRALLTRIAQLETDQGPESDAGRRAFESTTLYLDGLERLAMTGSATLTPPDERSPNDHAILDLLKSSSEERERFRASLYDIIGGHLVIDMSSDSPDVHWRLAPEPAPPDVEVAYGRTDYFEKLPYLAERSDGIHAVVGMLSTIYAKQSKVVFIDEPEAFLHPPLIRKFARQLMKVAREQKLQIFVATHSSEFVAGLSSSANELAILRLSHTPGEGSGHSSARLLHINALRRLAHDPLLRSQATLSALFCEGAVICEAAGDKTLYGEVNTRLVEYAGEGSDGSVFLNAQNWQTIGRMMRPLRELGVPAAAVVDSDVLFESELSRLMQDAQIPRAIRKSVSQLCGELKHSVRERIAQARGLDEEAKKKLGLKRPLIDTLTTEERAVFDHLLERLAEYGLFVVPVGELEFWLTPLGLEPDTQNKRKWLERALDRLGWDPESSAYVRTAEGDIWDFVRKIAAWINDPRRKGTGPGTREPSVPTTQSPGPAVSDRGPRASTCARS